MLIYCPKCQNLIDKIDEKSISGSIVRVCGKCQRIFEYSLVYKIVGKEIEPDLTVSEK